VARWPLSQACRAKLKSGKAVSTTAGAAEALEEEEEEEEENMDCPSTAREATLGEQRGGQGEGSHEASLGSGQGRALPSTCRRASCSHRPALAAQTGLTAVTLRRR